MKLSVRLVLYLSVCSGFAFGETYSKLDALDSIVQFIKGQLKMVDLVLDLDCANAKYPYGGGGKVIHGCAAIGNPECVKKVAARGGDIYDRDNRKMTALDYAEIGVTGNPDEYNKVLDLDYQGVVEALKELQNSTDYVVGRDCYLNHTEWEQLMKIAFKEFFEEAIEGGVNREVIYPIHFGGGTHLHSCASSNFYLCVHTMLQAGINPQIQDDAGKTAFQLAIDKGYLEVAQLIASFSVGANRKDALEVTSEKIIDPERILGVIEANSDRAVDSEQLF